MYTVLFGFFCPITYCGSGDRPRIRQYRSLFGGLEDVGRAEQQRREEVGKCPLLGMPPGNPPS